MKNTIYFYEELLDFGLRAILTKAEFLVIQLCHFSPYFTCSELYLYHRMLGVIL